MITRRFFLSASTLLACRPSWAQSTSSPLTRFDALLAGVTDTDVEASRASTELSFRTFSLVETQGQRFRAKSARPLSKRAKDLIVRFEVSSESYYKKALQSPTWPKGQSGVTIGFGYDIGYVKPQFFEEDWGQLLPADSVAKLKATCGLKGTAAQQAMPALHDIRVSWQAASQQFDAFAPYVVAETEAGFSNCADLSADSFGALVSLVYNRGSSAPPGKPRRAEMYNIKQLMVAKDFAAIPDQIRKMKRLWEGDPDMRGLLERRELEALLFEAGLTS